MSNKEKEQSKAPKKFIHNVPLPMDVQRFAEFLKTQ